MSPPSAAPAMLEAEFRMLAQEARSKEGLAGFFSSSADQQAVKDAAERVILKVRSCGEAPDAIDQIKTHYQEVLRPLQLSLDTKSDRLKSRALAITQNLIANHALPAEASEAVVAMLGRVDRNTDENVQLKTLQTALTLLQSPLRPHSEEQIGAVLGVCLKLTNKKGHKDAVLTTAAATVRQAVALVLSYVDVEAELQREQLGEEGGEGEEGDASAPGGAAAAAQKLVEDLCNIASGVPPLWLKSPSLPRTFVLELLDFLLVNSPTVFRQLPPFQNALAVRMTQAIQSQLQDHLDAGAAGASFATSNFSTFRALLRLARTLLRSFYPLLGPRSGTLVQALLAGMAPRYPLYQRIALMQLVRQLLADPLLTYHLFATYDMSGERKLDAVQALCRAAGDVVDATLRAVNKDPEDEPPLDVVAALYSDKTAGKDWTLDTDFEGANQQVQRGFLSMLSIDALLAFMGSVEKLADMAVDQRGEVPAALTKGPGSVERVEVDVCKAMVERTWRGLLAAISQLLQRSSGEEVVLQLLKGYQVFTQACGNLPLLEPRDAFLANLCEFALTSADAGIGELEVSPRGGALPAIERLASPRGSTVGGAGAGEAGAETGLVLAPKNVQSMRTLFNIAHRLSNVLGPAWALVLETMNTLDRILNSPRTTTQEVSAQSDDAAMPSDLVILAAAASQLFECTRDMSREAVVSLLSGLRDVSMRNVPAATAAVGQAPKLYALNRMVEVLLYNINRIYDLWGIFLSHVLEVINDSRPPVRAAAIDALGRAISGALGSLAAASQGAAAAAAAPGGTAGGAASGANDSAGGVEHMLLVALEALFNADNERDVRASVLRVLLYVLQRHGERLSDGWTPVFRLFAAVPAAEEADAINLAFQSLQLTCGDYMSAMPFARLKRCLEVAVLFSRQQADVNVSLTTISLLWNAADLFGKAAPPPAASRAGSARLGSAMWGTPAAANGDDESDTEVEAALGMPMPEAAEDDPLSEEEAVSPGGKRSQLAARLSAAQSEELLQMIFLALQGVSQDARPEVRNSGVRTLFAVVVNQGPRLSRALWEQCLWEMLFPLLNHAYLMSATASRDEAESMLLGQSRGKEIRVMVHHSRNSEQKQWDETVVIALGGMARLLRAHLPAIVGMDRVAAGWEEMMVVVESSMAGGRKEVALAAITLLSAVLQAHGAITDIVSPAMWKRAVRALGVGVEAATSPSCMVPMSARLELLSLVGVLYGALRSRFDAEDTTRVFMWVEKFSRNPWSDDDAANSAQVVMGMPPVQKAALSMLSKLAPTHLPQLYPDYIYSIVRLLRPEHVIEQWQEQQREVAERSAAAAAAQQQFSIPAEPPSMQQGPGSPPPAAGFGAGAGAELANGGLVSHASGTVKQPPGQVAQAKFALTSAFLEKVIEQLIAVFREAPLGVRATTFASVISALGRCMEVRYIVYHESLWRISAQAFNATVPAGLPALAAAATTGEDTAASWEALADTFETFLLGANVLASAHPSSHAHEPASSIASDASVLRVGTSSVDGASSRSVSQGQEVTSRAPGEGGTGAVGAGAAAAAQAAQAAAPVALAPAAAPTPLSPQQARQDAELEVAVLDCLTDVVLTQCAAAPADMKQRLISTVDSGASRPKELSVPQATTSNNFGHVCIRKMYVLCSRGGGGAADPEGCLVEVSRLALPMFMARCDAVLRSYAEDQARAAGATSSSVAPNRTRLDEVLCILEVLASMSLAPAVVDAAMPPSEFLTQMVRNLRTRPEVAARGRERTHLLLLYSALCNCITCKEPRVREMARDVLLLAGAELGLGVPLTALPSRQVSRQLSVGSAAAAGLGAAAGARLSSVDESASLV